MYKAYDSNKVLAYAKSVDMEAVISHKKGRKNQRELDRVLAKV